MKTSGYHSAKQTWIGIVTWILSVFAILCLAGCDGGSSNSRGTLAVSLTDAPACGFDAVNVTVAKVRVHQSRSAGEDDPGWAEIVLDPPSKLNLLDLTNGALEYLGQTPLDAGHYTQLRLVLAANSDTYLANSVIPSGNDDELPLDTPSAVQSGIKLINQFDVNAGERVDLLLDFDACKSVVTRGNGSYGLKPVIRVIPFLLNGIGGYVDPALAGDQVSVTAQSNGTVVRSTVPVPQTGEFFLSRLEPGTYDVVITANGHVSAVIAGIPIATATSTAMVSTDSEPISLPAATVHSVSGTISLLPLNENEVPFAAAKQTFPSGPTVTVKEHSVDLLSGAYLLNLSSNAPLLGQFGTGTLPIPLTEQAAIAGLYDIEATASGYQTQSASVNIATTDVTQNFVLVP